MPKGSKSTNKLALIRKELLKEYPETALPEFLQDRTVTHSRKGKLGRVRVKRFGGVIVNGTSKILKNIEQRAGGRDVVLSYLALNEPVPASIQKMIDMAKLPEKRATGLARLVAEAGVDAALVVTCYTKGLVSANQQEAIREAAEAMPHAVRELIRMALPKGIVCATCLGVGRIPSTSSGVEPVKMCPSCDGTGKVLEEHEKQEFALKELKEISGLAQKSAPQIQITKNTQNNVLLGPSFSETIVNMNDRLLHDGARPSLPPAPEPEVEEPVEAEVVEP